MTTPAGIWCDHCNTVVPGGDVEVDEDGLEYCPHCHGELGVVQELEEADAPPKAPWHFKVLLVGTVGYLIYRLIWFIEWLQHHH